MNTDVSIIVQARISSTRLPGKVMYALQGKAVLEHILERLQLAQEPKEIILATSTEPTDIPITELGQRMGVCVYCGSLNDVLERFHSAANEYKTSHIMRICADSPFVDPHLIDAGIRQYRQMDYDYFTCANVPLGCGYWMVPFAALENAYQNATEMFDREHVMPYAERTAKHKGQYVYPKNYSNYHLTLDTPADWTLVQKIYSMLYPQNHAFTLEDIIPVLPLL